MPAVEVFAFRPDTTEVNGDFVLALKVSKKYIWKSNTPFQRQYSWNSGWSKDLIQESFLPLRVAHPHK